VYWAIPSNGWQPRQVIENRGCGSSEETRAQEAGMMNWRPAMIYDELIDCRLSKQEVGIRFVGVICGVMVK
jgi:hypothetical protein